MYRPHNHCRACGYAKPGPGGIKSVATEKLIEVFDLGVQPLANDFCKDGEERSGYAPLKVLYCPRCSLAQLSVVVNPEILYRRYSYVTSPSQMMHDHFDRIIADIGKETELKKVLEIGSNDGRLLGMMKELFGYEVTGVDPAANLSAIASQSGVPTLIEMFSEHTAKEFLGQYDIVIARHVFCHADNWKDFIRGLEQVSHEATLICIEVPCASQTLEKVEFDQVYHEHLSFMTLKAMEALLKDSRLFIHKVHRYPIHGGAILIMLRHRDWRGDVNPESISGDAITVQDWLAFASKSFEQIDRLKATVETLCSQGKRIAGLGASAKSTVWINACKFNRKQINFISDTTPQKQYTFSPGTDIPIVDEGAILRDLPDYVILFAWNYREEILEKFSLARSKGIRFIIPVPEIKIV